MRLRRSLTEHAPRTVAGLDSAQRLRLATRLAVESLSESRALAAIVLRHVDPADVAAWSRAGHLARQLTYDSDPRVRQEAAISLACLAEEVSTAISRLRHDDRPGVRLAVTMAVGAVVHAAEVDALLTLLGDADVEVRRWAAFMLASSATSSAVVGEKRVEDGLCASLVDADREVRGEAMVGLAKLRSEDARFLGALLQFLHPDEYDDWSLEAAELISGREVVASLHALRDGLRRSGLEDEASEVDAVLLRIDRSGRDIR